MILIGKRLLSVHSFRTSFLCQSRLYSTAHAADRTPLRILFCGSDDFSIQSLKGLYALHQTSPNIVESIHVVHRPAKRTGRGLKNLKEVPIQKAATDLRLPLHVIDTFTGWAVRSPIRDEKAVANLLQPPDVGINLIIAVSFGLLVPPRILGYAKYGGLNVHPSLLPDLRGPAPVHHALLLDRPYTGITVQTLDPKAFDHGIRLLQSPAIDIPDRESCTVANLTSHLASRAEGLLLKCIYERLYEPPLIDRGWYANPSEIEADRENLASTTPASHNSIAHAPKITKETKRVDWALQPASDILRRVRVLGDLWDDTLLPGGKRVKLHRLSQIHNTSIFADDASRRPGSVVLLEKPNSGPRNVYVKTCDEHPGAGLKIEEWTIQDRDRNSAWPKS